MERPKLSIGTQLFLGDGGNKVSFHIVRHDDDDQKPRFRFRIQHNHVCKLCIGTDDWHVTEL